MEKEEKVAEVVGITGVGLTVVLLGAIMAFCLDEYRIDRENRKKGDLSSAAPNHSNRRIRSWLQRRL